MTDRIDRLRVFLSSRMAVLIDLRAMLKEALERQGLDVFVYEASAGARPESPEQASLAEVDRADIVVFVLEHTYGEVTEREYDHARVREKPCLVYVRQSAQAPDPDQAKFLAKLKGARGVPSRETFRDAVELAGKVATDIQAWLVREFRRLSAAVADQSTSPRQSSQFVIDMDRLRTATSAGLQTGGPADLLCWQLRLWFDALGYPLDGESSADGSFVEFVVRIPERRRAFVSVLVRAKHTEVLAPDVEQARARLSVRKEHGRVDECWVVAPQRVSPAARAAAEKDPDVSVFTLDEVIEEDVDFARYFEWLEGEAKREKLDEFYVPLAASVNEVSADGKSVGTSHYENVGVYVDQWLRDPSAEHVSLLGEFGAGKSWFSLQYAVTLARQYRGAQDNNAPRPRVPLLVRLRDYARGFKDVGALLTDVVFREHEINIPSYKALETLNRLGRLLFIFDGFDEMAARIDRQKMADNFWAMAAVLGPGSKAILTCRTEYFHFAQQARDVLGGKLRGSRMLDTTDTSRFQVAELAMFDRDRLEKVLSKKANPRQVRAVLANENLVDLAKRPVMVDLLIEAMPSLDPDRADLAQVYYLAVKRKMERDIGHQRTFTSMAEKMFFMCELSAEMLFTDQMKLHFKAFPERIRRYFGGRAQDIEEDHWHHDLLSQTMLVRDDEGHYRPAHRSLLEFFVAYKLAAEIGAIRVDYLTVFNSEVKGDSGFTPARYRWSTFFGETAPGRKRSIPVAGFVCDTEERVAASWGQAKVDGTLGELIYLLCGEDGTKAALASSGTTPLTSAHFVARLLSIQSRHGGLRGVEIEGAVVRGLTLSNMDMSGARLARTKWIEANLSNVRLDGADLTGTQFQNLRLIDVTLRDSKLAFTEWSDGVTMTETVSAAAWARTPHGEVAIVGSGTGRFFVVDPRASRAIEVEVTPPLGVKRWHNEVEGEIDSSPFGVVDFGVRPKEVPGTKQSPPWRMPLLAEFVQFTYESKALAGGDVDDDVAIVRMQNTDTELIRGRFVEASSRGGPEDSFITVAPSGRMLAGIRKPFSHSATAVVIYTDGTERALAGFKGGWNTSGSFSPSESIIAVSEGREAIGFWRTDTGDFIARFEVPAALSGAVVDGASGIPPRFLRFVTPSPDGWVLDTPVSGTERTPTG